MSKWLEKQVIQVLDRLGKKACKKFNYSYNEVKRVHRNDAYDGKVYGYYLVDSKEIRIALKKSKTRFFPIEELVDTMMHEIAHTRDTTHSPGWKERYHELKQWAKKYIHD